MPTERLPSPTFNLHKPVLLTTICLLVLSSVALCQSFKLVSVPGGAVPIPPVGINNNGQVVSAVTPQGGGEQVLLFSRTTSPQTITIDDNSFATAINNAGQIVGAAGNVSTPQAFLWQSNTGAQNLESLGADESIATSINRSGTVVGYNYFSQVGSAFLWTQANGMQSILPQITGGSFATAINSSEQVAGFYAPNGTTNWDAFVWTQAAGLKDLGTLGGTRTFAYAINDSGTVVGGSDLSRGFPDFHAFSWTQAGGIKDLGTLGGTSSTAQSANNRGWIVGTSSIHNRRVGPVPFLWTPGAGMQDLRKGFTPLSHATVASTAVNDAGVIAISTNQGLYVLYPVMSIAFSSTPNPSVAGQPVTFTASVDSIAGPPPDGEIVEFRQGSKLLGTAPLNGGVAQLTTSAIKAGSHRVSAMYVGDANYFPSKRFSLTQVVNP